MPLTSPALNYVPLRSCTDQNGNPLLIDQRGFSRPGHNQTACTVGAYEFNPPPLDCNAAVASAPHPGEVASEFWPENIEGLSNPFGTLVVTITGITEDYPVRRHNGPICSNAFVDGDTAWLRLESHEPKGLLYRIAFEAKDSQNANASCPVRSRCAFSSRGRINQPCVDSGQTYDATQCPKRRR